MTRKLIEHDIPLAEISDASVREKSMRHGYPSTLDIWWARRPPAAFLATAFTAHKDQAAMRVSRRKSCLKESVRYGR